MEENWTILKVLQWTAGYFGRKGIDQPRANAEVLLAHVLGKERIELYLNYDQPLTPDELSRYREAVRRRSCREPVQYITRRQEFWSLEFEVNPAVLIPRPETELLVERALELLPDAPARVLDLGTGSGAIAVVLARERPSFSVVATDRSPDALDVARRNALRHGVGDRISFLAMDLFSGFSLSRCSFDLIISNPPYIGEREFQCLPPEIAGHEPRSALRGGGAEGLDIIRRIVAEAPRCLNTGGSMLLEIGLGQAEPLQNELANNPHFEERRFFKDYSGIMRILYLRKR